MIFLLNWDRSLQSGPSKEALLVWTSVLASQISNVLSYDLSIKRWLFSRVKNIRDKISNEDALYIQVIHVGQVYIMNLFDNKLSLTLAQECLRVSLALIFKVKTEVKSDPFVKTEHLGDTCGLVVEQMEF